MKRQIGSTLTIILVVTAIIAAIGFTIFASYVSAYNHGNRAEKQIVAMWENNENVLAQYSLKISEMAQVPDMQRDDLKEVYTEVMAGRYGDNGSQAMFQWLQEQNPQLDATVYTRLQQTMEAGRNEFRVAQTNFRDAKRGYETALGSFWQGLWLRIAGYPTINLDEYKLITSGHARDSFETGIDPGLTLRAEKTEGS